MVGLMLWLNVFMIIFLKQYAKFDPKSGIAMAELMGFGGQCTGDDVQ